MILSRYESFGFFVFNSPIIAKIKNLLFNLNHHSGRYFRLSCIATDFFFLDGLLTLVSNRKSELPPKIIRLVNMSLTLINIFLSSLKMFNCSFSVLALFKLSNIKNWPFIFMSRNRTRSFVSIFPCSSFKGSIT